MKINDANTIIAEYMGKLPMTITERVGIAITQRPEYESLDALVPVWEKLSTNSAWLNINRHGIDGYNVAFFADHSGDKKFISHGTNIQQAAAIATAKCIRELGK